MRKKKVFVKGLRCPRCKRANLQKKGIAYGAKGSAHRRFHCAHCNYFTIHPERC